MMSWELDLISIEGMERSLDAQGSGLGMTFLVPRGKTMLTRPLQTQRQNFILENTGPAYIYGDSDNLFQLDLAKEVFAETV